MVDGQFQIVLGVRLLMVTMVISDLYLMVVGAHPTHGDDGGG